MQYRWDKKYLYWGMTAFIVICLSILFNYLLTHGGGNVGELIKKTLSICSPIIDGLVIAFLITPFVNWIENKFFFPYYRKKDRAISEKKKRWIRVISLTIAFIVVLSIIVAFFYTIIPQIIYSIDSIINQSSIYKQNIEKWLNDSFARNPEIREFITDSYEQYSGELSTWVKDNLAPKIQDLAKTVSLSFISFLKALWNILIGMIISVYVIFNKEKFSGQFKKLSYGFMGIKTGNAFISNMRMINDKFSGFIIGKLLDSLIIGVLCFAGASILQMPYPILLSIIIGVTNIIPFFGPIIGAIPCALLVFMINPIQTIYFLIFILILQQFDGNILGPKILGVSTGISSFWVIFSITIFGGIWGVPGMIIGVPLFAVIYACIKALLKTKLTKRGLSISTSEYTGLDYIDTEHENAYVELKKNYRLEESNPNEDKPEHKMSLFRKIKKNKNKKDINKDSKDK